MIRLTSCDDISNTDWISIMDIGSQVYIALYPGLPCFSMLHVENKPAMQVRMQTVHGVLSQAGKQYYIRCNLRK